MFKCDLKKPNTFDEDGCSSQCDRCKTSEISWKRFIKDIIPSSPTFVVILVLWGMYFLFKYLNTLL